MIRTVLLVLSISISCSVAMAQSIKPTSVAGDMKALDERIASLLPTEQEDRWRTIPWRTNLLSARAEAQEMNRPMFLWIMNGHPMGCT
ncbi:MAG: hypothetical protein K2Z81_12190 [Cyanobacteria bacterium]|nr:hypothetical protein [Cyanobacteriota bacterium]